MGWGSSIGVLLLGGVLGAQDPPRKEPPKPQSLAHVPLAKAAPRTAPPTEAAPPIPEPSTLPALPTEPEPPPAPLPIRIDPIAHGLRYRMRVRMRGERDPLELRFKLVPTPARTTANRVKKPRLGGWRLEAERGGNGQLTPAWLLARAERLLYLSGPSPQLAQEPWSLTFGHQACPVWSLEVPHNLRASAYLVEVAPNLLALCDLHARFERGDMASLDLQLEAFGWRPGSAPPENGTALLGTLQRWAHATPGPSDTERVE